MVGCGSQPGTMQEVLMSEQREEERKILMAFTPVFDMHKNRLMGYLGDLTLQGAMVVGDMPVEIDQKITLGIEFRETPETPATRMVLPVRVAWGKKEETSPYYKTGVEFLELTNKDKKVIEAILERYQFRRQYPGEQ
jgi:PilZ domain